LKIICLSEKSGLLGLEGFQLLAILEDEEAYVCHCHCRECWIIRSDILGLYQPLQTLLEIYFWLKFLTEESRIIRVYQGAPIFKKLLMDIPGTGLDA